MSALHATEDNTRLTPADVPAASAQFACSLAQRRFWVLEQLDPGNPALNVAVRWRLEGRLAHADLERAWRLLLERHGSLRTCFGRRGGEPIQIVAPKIAFAIPVIDLSRLEESQALAEADRLARQEVRVSFNIAIPPLVRVTRLQLPGEVAILLVTAHHLIADGWSVGILAREMGEISAALQQVRRRTCRSWSSATPTMPNGSGNGWRRRRLRPRTTTGATPFPASAISRSPRTICGGTSRRPAARQPRCCWTRGSRRRLPNEAAARC